MKERYKKWIENELVAIAADKYPGDKNLQQIYQIGFLRAQLTEAMYADSHVESRFRAMVNRVRGR